MHAEDPQEGLRQGHPSRCHAWHQRSQGNLFIFVLITVI